MAKYTHDSNGYYFLDGEFVRRSQVVALLNAAEAMEEALAEIAKGSASAHHGDEQGLAEEALAQYRAAKEGE